MENMPKRTPGKALAEAKEKYPPQEWGTSPLTEVWQWLLEEVSNESSLHPEA